MLIKRLLAIPFYGINRFIKHDLHKAQVARWYFYNGDKVFLTNYPLTAQSIVFDVGGYIGVFSDKIIAEYDPYIFIFEPVGEYFNKLSDKYRNNTKVKLINAGLSDKNSSGNITVQGEKSSVFLNEGPGEKIKMLDILDFCQQSLGNSEVDLMSINIEGGEYALLNRIIETGLINKIKSLQVQFHQVFPEHSYERSKILQLLGKTHKVAYSFPYVWEGFERNE